MLLAEDSPFGLVLYATKCAYLSKDDEGEKFRYLRLLSNMWAERGWDKDDKRIILLAINYLINLRNEIYAKEFVTHMKSLDMNEEDKEMYVSVFERVYKEEGRVEGRVEERAEIARNMFRKGYAIEEIAECTRSPAEEVETYLTRQTPAL